LTFPDVFASHFYHLNHLVFKLLPAKKINGKDSLFSYFCGFKKLTYDIS